MKIKKSLLACTLALGLLSGACLGPNRAFEEVHDWNKDVSDNKWVAEAVHVGMWIIPVYSLALLGDIIIFNSIEWWGGDNPIDD